MLKLVIAVFLLIFLLVTVIIIKSKYKVYQKTQNQNYEIYTKPVKQNIISSYILVILSISLYAISIILYFENDSIGYWSCLILGFILGSIASLINYVSYFSYEGLKNNKIYIHRFNKTKEVLIDDIFFMTALRDGTAFLNKYQEFLFTSKSIKYGTELIVNKIKEHHYIIEDLYKNIMYTKKLMTDEEIELYERFGKLLKQDKKESIKNFKTGYLIVTIIFVCSILFLSIYYSWLYSIFFVLFGFINLIIYNVLISKKKEIYNMDDFELGFRHYKDCKAYIGHQKYVFKGIFYNCLIWFCFGILIGTIFLIPTTSFKLNSYDEYKEVNGTLEYSYIHDSSKNDFIGFSIYEDNVEYRISSIFVDEFDYSFFDSVKKGDPIVFYASYDIRNGKSLFTNEYSDISYIYYVKCNDTEYFGYEDMVKGHIDNINVARKGYIVCYSISILSIFITLSSYIICLKTSKYETMALKIK